MKLRTEKGMLLDYSSRRRRNIFIVLREEIYYIKLLKKILTKMLLPSKLMKV